MVVEGSVDIQGLVAVTRNDDMHSTFHGEVIAMLHLYQFAIGEQAAREIMEVYDYEWTDEEI